MHSRVSDTEQIELRSPAPGRQTDLNCGVLEGSDRLQVELNAVTNCTLRKSKSREPRDRTVARAPLLERIPRLSPRAACGQTHEACGSAVLLATTCTARSLRALAALGTTPPRACAWTAGGMAAWLAAEGPSTSDSMWSQGKSCRARLSRQPTFART